MSHVEIEPNSSLEDIYARWDDYVPKDPRYQQFIEMLLRAAPTDRKTYHRAFAKAQKALKLVPRKSHLLALFAEMVRQGVATMENPLRALLVKKGLKSSSGVLVVTVLTSPYPRVGEKVQRFTCKWNCYYCPNEPGQPRSYLHDEPGVLRANRNGFDPVLQFHDRAATLAMNGHPVDKIEILVLGGTWSSYPEAYQEEFCRDIFYAANTFWSAQADAVEVVKQRLKLRAEGATEAQAFAMVPSAKETMRQPKSLAEEHALNESAQCKIIGLTLETRPDCINAPELANLRRYGCTRVQIGIQHTDDAILKLVNRGSTLAHTKQAVRQLLDNGFKVDGHLMPDLPGTTPEKDWEMFRYVLESPHVRLDQIKVYPHQVVDYTVTKKWLETGKHVPFEPDVLIELLIKFKAAVHPWIRLNRVVRDIPGQYISGGCSVTNLRQHLLHTMAQRGVRCKCIRCREVRLRAGIAPSQTIVERRYAASEGEEVFLSFESEDRHTLFAFLRLRLTSCAGVGDAPSPGAHGPLKGAAARNEETDEAAAKRRGVVVFPELRGAALIRELHVYGKLRPTSAAARAKTGSGGARVQHAGFGRRLMDRAEAIAAGRGFRKLSVISGIGAREYYRKLGYEVEAGAGGFMTKHISRAARCRGAARACNDCAGTWWRAPVAVVVMVAALGAFVRLSTLRPFARLALNVVALAAAAAVVRGMTTRPKEVYQV